MASLGGRLRVISNVATFICNNSKDPNTNVRRWYNGGGAKDMKNEMKFHLRVSILESFRSTGSVGISSLRAEKAVLTLGMRVKLQVTNQKAKYFFLA